MSDQAGPITFTYVDQHGDEHQVDANVGDSLMSVAKNNDIDGIDGDCGGCCACGTCRVVLEASIADDLTAPEDEERDILEFSADDITGQRLGCQVPVSAAFQGARVTVATE